MDESQCAEASFGVNIPNPTDMLSRRVVSLSSNFMCFLPPLSDTLSSTATNSCYGCTEAGSVTIEGPLRRKTLLKEGRKPRVRWPLISLWVEVSLCSLNVVYNVTEGVFWWLWVCCSCHRGPDFGSLCLDQHWHSMGPKHWGPLRESM